MFSVKELKKGNSDILISLSYTEGEKLGLLKEEFILLKDLMLDLCVIELEEEEDFFKYNLKLKIDTKKENKKNLFLLSLNDLNKKFVGEILEEENYNIRTFSDAKRALEEFLEEEADYLIIDLDSGCLENVDLLENFIIKEKMIFFSSESQGDFQKFKNDGFICSSEISELLLCLKEGKKLKFSINEAMKNFDNSEMLVNTVGNKICKTLEKELKELKELYNKKEFDKFSKKIHKLRGSLSFFYSKESLIRKKMEVLELKTLEKKVNIKQVKFDFEMLIQELELFQEHFL